MKDDLNDLPPVYKDLFEHMSPPAGQGNAYFKLNWTILLLFVPFLMYFLTFINHPFVNYFLLIYSVILALIDMLLIYSFKKAMAFESNPFDFVAVQLLNFVLGVIALGLSFYFLLEINNYAFQGIKDTLSVLDMIYYSFITVATVGYGDIIPVSPVARVLSIFEIIYGFWFVVTIIPVAVADQAERIRHYRETKENLMSKIEEDLENGQLKKVYTTENKNEDKE